jgi:hypothetical protein
MLKGYLSVDLTNTVINRAKDKRQYLVAFAEDEAAAKEKRQYLVAFAEDEATNTA